MKVLLINKYFYIKGGTETYFFGIKRMLENQGNKVITFSMKSDNNFTSVYDRYFVNNVNYQNQSITNKFINAIKLINSKEAYKKLCKLIEDTRPNVAHVNLIYHQITPSIFHALKKYNIPVVFTSHDYKIICPNYKVYNKNKTCKKCYNGNFYMCLINKCHKNSFISSLLVTIEAYYHKIIKSYSIPNRIICPSSYMKNQLIEGGIDNEKLIHIPSFISDEFIQFNLDSRFIEEKENTILYFGRLSYEKGVDLLIEAKKYISKDIKLKIIGTGPEENKLRQFVKIHKVENVEFLGFKIGIELYNEIKKSKCTVISSRSEVFGLTVIESYCLGTPVVGANTGGISELIKDKVTGFVFDNESINDLVNKINALFSMSNIDYANMVNNCLNEKEKYRPNLYYSQLMKVYNMVIEEKN